MDAQFSAPAIWWLGARARIALALTCIVLQLALAGPGPGGQSDLALWAFALVPFGGLFAFRAGWREVIREPRRLAGAQLMTGALALGTPGILLVYSTRGDIPTSWKFITPFFYAPILGWIVFLAGFAGLRRGWTRRVPRSVALAGAFLLSVPWIFLLYALVDITFGDD